MRNKVGLNYSRQHSLNPKTNKSRFSVMRVDAHPRRLLLWGLLMNEDYFWLKIHEHFFDEDNILYLESLQNGEKYILFWQKLLLKCLKNKDREDKNYSVLRFAENIPYDPEILSKVTRTDIDTVKVAIDAFKKLGMIEILSDGSIYIESVHKLIGKRSESADRVKKYREKKKLLQVTNGNATSNTNKEEEEIKNKEVEEINKKQFIIPDLISITNYFTSHGYSEESAKRFYNYYDAGEWKDSKGNKVKNWKQKAQAVWFKDENKIKKEQPKPKTLKDLN